MVSKGGLKMKIYRKFLMVILTAVLVILGACVSSDEQSTTISDEPEVNNVSENTDEENDEQDEFTDQTVNEEEKSTENNNNQIVTEKHENEKQKNIKTEPTTNSEEVHLESTDENEKNPSESKENIQITSGEEAIQYLKQQIKEGKNDDISFGATETVDTDDYGSYYTIQLVDIPLRISGKTGTLGYYKVYRDGTYELYEDRKST